MVILSIIISLYFYYYFIYLFFFFLSFFVWIFVYNINYTHHTIEKVHFYGAYLQKEEKRAWLIRQQTLEKKHYKITIIA